MKNQAADDSRDVAKPDRSIARSRPSRVAGRDEIGHDLPSLGRHRSARSGAPAAARMNDDQLFELTQERIAEAKVVVVDDDTLVTSSLASFFSLEMEIDAVVFNESPRAARYLEQERVDLIISDFLMPQMDGLQLLAVARKTQPEAPRILLTGYADKENAIKAINEVGVFQYIEKPWENEQLRHIVINGLTKRMLMSVLADKMKELQSTRADLAGLRHALVRAFA